MGLRIREREEAKRQDLYHQMLLEEAARFGAFRGQEAEEDFLRKLRQARDKFLNSDLAEATAHRLEETIRQENKRSMDTLGRIEPRIVLDLL